MTTFQQNYNSHLNELKAEKKILQEIKSDTDEAKMVRSQMLAINRIKIENTLKAFII